MSEVKRDITIDVRTRADQGPRKSTERIDELGDHASKTTARLLAAGKAGDRFARSMSKVAVATTAANAALRAFNHNGKELERMMFKIHKLISAFGGMMMKGLTFGLKAATLSLGAMSLALVGIHALFITGRFLVKAYHVALKGLAASAASFAVALSVASAAIREQQAAIFAYRGTNNKEFGSGLNQTRVNMRGLHMDAQLAGAGVEALNKAFSEIAKSKTGYNASSKTLLKGLGDFAAAGQPLEEGLQKAAAVVVALQDPKKGLGAVHTAFKELGPAAEEALKKAKKEGIDTKKEFIEAMKSGKLSMLGGVTGQFEAVNNTLVGQLRKYFNLIRGKFADFGQQFLPEAKVGLERIYNIIVRTMDMTSGAVAGWEKRGGLIDAMVNAVQKVSDFYLYLVRDWLPASVGGFKRLGEWWDGFREGWDRWVDSIREFQDGARVIEKTFGNAWRPVWAEVKRGTKEFNESLVKNQPAFEKFGSSLGETVKRLLQILRVFERLIVKELPFIARVFDGLSAIFKQFTDTFKFLSSMFGDRGAFMAMMGMARGMKTNRGTLVDTSTVNQMNVKAGSVSISGAIKGAIQGAKVGAHPALAGPTAGVSIPVGAAIGAAANSGLLGPKAQAFFGRFMSVAGPVTAATSPVGAATTAAGAAASAVPAVTRAAASRSAPVVTGHGAAAARAAATAAATRGAASSSTSSVGGAAQGVTASLRGLRSQSGSTTGGLRQATKGLSSFNRALGAASRGLRSGGGTPSGGTPTPTPTGSRHVGGRHSTAGGSPRAAAQMFSLASRGMAAVGGFGKDAADRANQQRAGTGFKGLDGGAAAFGLAMLMSKLSENPNLSKDIAGGLSLAATAAMFSPRLGLGIAGGTMALRSENAMAATAGGGLAGGLFGAQFGAKGLAIGTTIGSITGFINSNKSRDRNNKKEADAMLFENIEKDRQDKFTQMALLEGAQIKSGKGKSTLADSLRKSAEKRKKNLATAQKGNAKVEDSGRGLRDYVTFGATIGAGIGMAVGMTAGAAVGAAAGGVGAVPGAFIGGAKGTLIGGGVGGALGAVAFGVDKVGDLLFNREDRKRNKVRLETLEQMRKDGSITQDQFESLTEKKKKRFGRDTVDQHGMQTFIERFIEKQEAEMTAELSIADSLQARTQLLAKTFGMTEIEVVQLAQTMGVNLADNTQDLNDVMSKLGLTVVKTAEQIDQALSEKIINSLTVFDAAIRQETAPNRSDEVMKNFRQDFDQRGPNAIVTAEDFKNINTAAITGLTDMFGGDTTRASFEFLRMMGDPSGAAFREFSADGKKNVLGGLGNKFFDAQTLGGQANINFIKQMKEDMFNTTVKDQLTAVMANEAGVGFSSPEQFAQFKKSFMELDLNQQERIVNQLSTGSLGTDPQQFFAQMGLGGLINNSNLNTLTDDQKAFAIADETGKKAVLLEAERKNIEAFGKFFAPGAEKPEWWSKEALIEVFKAAGIDTADLDTKTPRGKGIGDTSSRLAQTLSRHQSINSMLAGKRTITSSYRTNHLGSINSDHITGRAYDLVGNQLGMYKTIVERDGGFAEFHGGSTNRHLHVVPGNGGGPMGDTVGPYTQAMASAPVSQSGSGAPVSVNVNLHGLGMDEAIPKIKAAIDRSMYEYQNRR